MKVPTMSGAIGNSNSAIVLDVDDGYYHSVTGTDFVDGDTIAQGESGGANQYGGFYLFTSIPTLAGKTLTDARLVLRTKGGDSGSATVKLKIMAEDVASPVFPINAADARGAVRTTAQIDWDDIPFAAEPHEITSPNIKTIIQELVDTHTVTAILIFVDDDGSATNKNLQVYGRNEGSGQGARLKLSF